MKKALIGLTLVGALTVGACGTTPAQYELIGCQTYATTLSELADLRAAGKLSATQVKYVDAARPGLNAICDAPPPDIDKKALDTALDAGVRALVAIVTQAKGGA